jgi:hypothetical protein
MASTQCTPVSFLRELFLGLHVIDVGGDVLKLALFTSSATLNSSTTAYSTTGEITLPGYTAGGLALTNIAPATSGVTAYCDFEDVTFSLTGSGIRYGLIYNSSKANRAVSVLDFGLDKTAQTSFLVTFPPAGALTAIVRITGS